MCGFSTLGKFPILCKHMGWLPIDTSEQIST
jgi:hypothetical protein